MLKYIIKRLLALIPVLIGISVLVFLIMHLSPGDPAKIILGPRATQTTIDEMHRLLGLDLPLHEQYFRWIGNIFQGDWGTSIQLRQPVRDLVMQRLGATLLLTVAASMLSIVIGMAAGIISATKQYSFWDRALMTSSLVGFCLPVFWAGLLLQLLFSIKLGWLPVSGMHSAGQTGVIDLLKHMILPTFALSLGSTATIARMTRSSMLDVVRQDYIKTARAKGVSERKIAYVHSLRNALIPVITVIGMQIGYLLSGQVLLEIVFAWPGLGSLMVNAILARDFPLVQGAILFVATGYVLINLLVDILYAVLDPRITY